MAIELYSKATLDTLLAAKLSDAPSDGSIYGRKDGGWTVVTGSWSPGSGDLNLGGYSITNGNVDCSAGYVTAMNFTVTSGGSITFPDTTLQTTAWTGVAPGKTVNNIDMSSADYYLTAGDANNIINISAGDGSSSGFSIKITADSTLDLPIGTVIIFTNSATGTYNYINPDSGVTVIQNNNSFNYGYIKTAIKLAANTWIVSTYQHI